MPAFRQFRPSEMSALLIYVSSPPVAAAADRSLADRHTIDYTVFSDQDGVPRLRHQGHAERGRSQQGRDSLESPARRVSAARREGHSPHRHDELRRDGDDGRWRRVRGGHRGREDSRVRGTFREAVVGAPAAGRRPVTPSVYMVNGDTSSSRRVAAARTAKSGDAVVAFAA